MTTVLVVDDEPEIRTSLHGILAEDGLRVLEAAERSLSNSGHTEILAAEAHAR